MIGVRRARPCDARPITAFLNPIITRGGTTAHTAPVTGDMITAWMVRGGAQAAWHVAEDDNGMLLGVQFVEPHPDLPLMACDIASFVRIGRTGLGIGTRLFEASRPAARAIGYAWINATIRADNAGGLAYYRSLGFLEYARDPGTRLGDGTVIDRISKRLYL
ncbi:GNAT family N-acetyltransferase [Roseovarius sp. TE539]|uniref:GNAT family N-acetyltransferase n=1 Tax=Roseovarius sp. TE539 TaxID=2249812 RepID=UPI000DE01C5F|nr:GNAT family N-acetyltransferase [Roseovarius sp. TE539]RBI77653.1 GNAT family N-acetyltransferase [Roseovarius sp. TE539]